MNLNEKKTHSIYNSSIKLYNQSIKITPCGSGLEMVVRTWLLHETVQGPASQRMWQVKRPSLLKGPRNQAKTDILKALPAIVTSPSYINEMVLVGTLNNI